VLSSLSNSPALQGAEKTTLEKGEKGEKKKAVATSPFPLDRRRKGKEKEGKKKKKTVPGVSGISSTSMGSSLPEEVKKKGEKKKEGGGRLSAMFFPSLLHWRKKGKERKRQGERKEKGGEGNDVVGSFGR